MRTLYLRIVLTFVLIAFVSSVIALFAVNLYYQNNIKAYSEQKVLDIGKEMHSLYEKTSSLDMNTYFTHIANMGFQIYTVNEQLEGRFYGDPFKYSEIDPLVVQRVLAGETHRPESSFITGLFANNIQHSIAIPVDANGQRYAMFIRPNLEQQFGEVRTLTGLLLAFTFFLSLIFILISTRYIVQPVEKLTEATKNIVEGDYRIELDMHRQDEIGNLARHFSKMAHALEKLDDMRQEFVANVSHEIQSPLTSIQGFAQAIRTEETTPEETNRYLEIIEAESRRLSSLSKQLLTLAALDKEADVVNKSAYRLDEQIRQDVLLSEWQLQEKGIDISLDLPEIVITADKALLDLVWLNLITNSIKFSNPRDHLQIRIAIDRDISIFFSDNGPGIPESEVPYIFDRFYKADKARNRSHSGSGLGLSIAKKIVQLHEGTIDVQSEPGEGATFIVRLPHL